MAGSLSALYLPIYSGHEYVQLQNDSILAGSDPSPKRAKFITARQNMNRTLQKFNMSVNMHLHFKKFTVVFRDLSRVEKQAQARFLAILQRLGGLSAPIFPCSSNSTHYGLGKTWPSCALS